MVKNRSRAPESLFRSHPISGSNPSHGLMGVAVRGCARDQYVVRKTVNVCNVHGYCLIVPILHPGQDMV